jgi:hypothetical protein
MTDSILFRWEIDDGYVGRDRPQYVKIHLDDLCKCKTATEVEILVSKIIRDEYENKFGPSWDSKEMAGVISAWRRRVSQKKGESDE